MGNSIKISINHPTLAKAEISCPDIAENFEKFLSFKNTSAEYLLKAHLNNLSWKYSNHKSWLNKLKILQNQVNQSVLVSKQDNGIFFIRPGFIDYLSQHFECDVSNNIIYPTPKPRPWYCPLPVELYPYQKEAIEKLLGVKHGAVELFTGAGKSYIILSLAQKLGLKTIVTTPSISIFEELLALFKKHLGPSSIGALGGGKKILNKNIIIAVADSLTTLKPDSEQYKQLANFDVLICDESHTLPAHTLENVCHGILKNIPYRFFLSGTQIRNDGTTKMLHSIIGKIVLTMLTKDGIKNSYICPHQFNIVKLKTTFFGSTYDKNALTSKRNHFLYNTNIANFIANLIKTVIPKKQQVLVLVDEIKQIEILMPLLENIPGIKTAVATGTKEYGKPSEAVEKFNLGQANVLIGTACIATGTNIYPTHHTINWQGGSSEIKTKQGAVGRSVRLLEKSKYAHLHTPKPIVNIWDFDVVDAEQIRYQLYNRIKFYKDSGVPINWINI